MKFFKAILNNENVKNSLLYTSGNYFFKISLLLSNLITSRILGPSFAGIISYFNAIDQNINIPYSTLRSSLERETPKLIAQNNNKETEMFASVSFTFSYILFLLGSFFYLGYALYSSEYLIQITCFFFIGINFLKALSDLLRIYHKSLSNFSAITITLIVISLVQPLIVYFLVEKYLYTGYLWTRVFLFAFSCVFFIYFLKKYPKLVFEVEWSYFKKILILGSPIVLFGFVLTLITTVDKFFMKFSLGDEMLGYYSIGGLIFQMLLVLPSSLYGSYFPKFITYKGNQDAQINKLTNIIQLIMIPVIFISWLFIPVFIKIVLPQFALGITSAKIIIISIYFCASYQMHYFELIRLNKFKKLLKTMVFLVITVFIIYGLLSIQKQSLEVYSYLNILVFVLFSSSVTAVAMLENNKKISDIFKATINDVYKVLPLFVFLMLDYYYEYSLKMEFLKTLLFLAIYLPFFLKNKKDFLTILLKK